VFPLYALLLPSTGFAQKTPSEPLEGFRAELVQTTHRGYREAHRFEVRSGKYYVDGVEIPELLLPVMAPEIRALRGIKPGSERYCHSGEFVLTVGNGKGEQHEYGCTNEERFQEVAAIFARLASLPIRITSAA
jgi:hypothetical protein